MKKITLFGVLAILLSFSQANAQQDISELLERFEQLKNSPGNISEFFTTEELNILKTQLSNGQVNDNTSNTTNGADVFASGWESQGLGFGNFNVNTPDPFTTLSTGSGTPDFEAAGAIDTSDNSIAYVADNNGEFFTVEIATGTYTALGNTGVIGTTGLEFNPEDGSLFMTTATDLFSVDVSTTPPTATLVGPIGTSGAIAIALAIDNDGVGYTYDIGDDTFYSIDLTTGVSTAIGPIGFDASFGQGMFYDQVFDQVFLASLNAGAGNLGELRTVDLATGATTLVGEWNPGVVSQMAWASVANQTLSVEDNILADNISVYPNPTNGDLNINFTRNFGATSVAIINVNGQNVLNTSMEGFGNNTLATSKLANGIYFAQITNETGIATIKFIKN